MKKAAASRTRKSGATRIGGERTAKSVGDQEVTIDRRRSHVRQGEAGKDSAHPAASQPKLERRQKVNRRRQIDPTTCERDYTGDEIEFMNALDDYKRKSGRMFPTCSEVLEVVRSLGYVKDIAAGHGDGTSTAADSATTSWFAGLGGASTVADEEAMFEATLTD
jgi:hypothetical protein